MTKVERGTDPRSNKVRDKESEVADALAPQIAQFTRLLEATGAEKIEDLGIPPAVLQGIASPGDWEEEQMPRF